MYITAPCFEAEKYITGRKTYITGRRNYITALKRTTSEVVKPTSWVSPISTHQINRMKRFSKRRNTAYPTMRTTKAATTQPIAVPREGSC